MAINTFILGIIDGQPHAGSQTEYVSNEGKKITGDPKELLVAASNELGSIKRFISRRHRADWQRRRRTKVSCLQLKNQDMYGQ